MMMEEYIKSLIDQCIAVAIPEEPPVAQLVDLSEPSIPYSNPKVTEWKRKRDEMKSQLEERESCFSEEIDRLRGLLKDNRELNKHVSVIDAAFSDLVRKYEKAKTAIMYYRQREGRVKEDMKKMNESIKTIEDKYHRLKAHGFRELEKGNTEILRVHNNYETEIHRLTSFVERMKIKYAIILQDMKRKTEELDALTTVFDEWCSTVRK